MTQKLDHRKDFVDVSALFGRYIAAWIIPRIRDTRITVLEVTGLAFVSGLAASGCILIGTPAALCAAAVLIQVKNIFDTIDGGLARARKTPSAIGRYADSIADFLTSAAFFWAIAELLSRAWGRGPAYSLALLALLSQLVQCSYYVFYMVRYLASGEPYGPFDARHQTWANICKVLYRLIYGWQDALVAKLDRTQLELASGAKMTESITDLWYKQKRLLFLNSFIGLGTQLFLMSVMLWIGRPGLYLWFMVGPLNIYLAFLITYRRRVLHDLLNA